MGRVRSGETAQSILNQAADTAGRMGYKVLEKGKTFASQVTEQNTIYEIRDMFLVSDDVTVPQGCVLRFEGGKIEGNGTLTFSDSRIEGNACITCGIAGTIDGVVHIEWFGLKKNDQTFDNGAIINKVVSVFKSTSVESGTLYYSTPILAENAVFADWNANFVYNGVYGNLSSITFDRHNVQGVIYNTAKIYIRSVACDTTGVDYRTVDENYLTNEGTETVILRGVTFEGFNNCDVRIGAIRHFNENVRISDIHAKGNCYNRYQISSSFNANVHLRIYQDNGGWTNGNEFTLQRATNSYSSFSDSQGHYYSCAIMAAGPGTQSDTQNGTHNQTFSKLSAEGFDSYAVLLKNCSKILFVGGRCESPSSLNPNFISFVRVVGSLSGINISGTYLSRGAWISYSEGSSFSKAVDAYDITPLFHVTAQDLLKHLHKTGKTDYFAFDNGVPVGFGYYKYKDVANYAKINSTDGYTADITSNGNLSFKTNYYLCFKLDTSTAKVFSVSTLKSTQSLRITYLKDSEGNAIGLNKTSQENFGKPVSSPLLSWDSNTLSFDTSIGSTKNITYTFVIPSGVSEILVKVFSGDFTLFSVNSSYLASSRQFVIPVFGTTLMRPKNTADVIDYDNMVRTNDVIPYIGFQYFDSDLGKYICWNGTAWVNMDGTALSE